MISGSKVPGVFIKIDPNSNRSCIRTFYFYIFYKNHGNFSCDAKSSVCRLFNLDKEALMEVVIAGDPEIPVATEFVGSKPEPDNLNTIKKQQSIE